MGVFVGWLSGVHTFEYHGRESGNMEGGGHGRSFRQNPETDGKDRRCAQLPQGARIQGLLLRSAHHRWIRGCHQQGLGETYPKTNKIIWLNMRQEPIVYVNGNPICARPPNKIGEYAELGNVTRDSVKKDEEEFMRVVEGRAKGNDGKLKYVDVSKKEVELEVKEIKSLSEVIEGLKEKYPGLVHMRIPVCNSAAPTEADFDTLCKTLEGSAVNCPVIVNCQVGLSRSTTGCVAACLFREFQLAASYEGLVETVPGVNLDLLKMDRYSMDMSKDPLFRGEFEVIKELRDHGRRRPGLPQDQDHGQHPQVLLHHLLHRLPAQARQDLRGLHVRARQAQTHCR